jgi:hypothetical protein
MDKKNLFLIFISISLYVSPLYAYVGPGISGGLIASVLGFIGAFFLALFGILYYPIKRMIKSRKKDKYNKN